MAFSVDDNTNIGEFSLDGGVPASPPTDPITAANRAETASFGLTNPTGIPKDTFHQAITNGQESTIRVEAANKVDGIKQQMAKQLISERGDTMSDEELITLLKAQDPNSVFEDHFANSYIQHIFWPTNPDNNAQDSDAFKQFKTFPGETQEMHAAASSVVAKNEYLKTKLEDSENRNTWYNRGSPFMQAAQDLLTFGIYSELALRKSTAGTGHFEALGLGNQLWAQRSNLYGMPYEDFKQEVDRVVESLPRDLQTPWLSSMLERTNDGTITYNIFSAALALGGAKSALNATKDVARAGLPSLYKSFASMTNPRNPAITPRVAAPAVAGNLKEAAFQKVLIDKINEFSDKNSPLKGWVDRVRTFANLDRDAIKANPGNLGQEAANRLADMADSMGTDLIETAQDAVRVDPNPTSRLGDRLRDIQRHILNGMFKGRDNKVLAMSRDLPVPGLNVYAFNIATGTSDGLLFKSAEEAAGDARLDGFAIKGDYAVDPKTRVKLIYKENAIKGLRAQAANAATPEGAAKANALADKYQKQLDAVPRHTTGVTIESQPTWRYSAPIGPERPEPPGPMYDKPNGPQRPVNMYGQPIGPERPSVAPTIDPKKKLAADLTRQELKGAKSERNLADTPKQKELVERKIKRLEKDLAELEGNPEETFDQWIERIGKTDRAELDANTKTLKSKIADTVQRSVSGRFMPKESGGTKEQIREGFKSIAEDRLNETGQMYGTPIGPERPNPMYEAPIGPPAPIVVQQGNGYYINHVVYLPEQANFVRDGILTNKYRELTTSQFREKLANSEIMTGLPTSTWLGGWMNAVFGRYLGPDLRLSSAEIANRLVAQHGPSVLLGLVRKGMEPVEQIPKKYWTDFNRMMKYTQQAWNNETKTPGIWFKDPSEVSDFYQRNFRRDPTEAEAKAYFAYKALMLDDMAFRELAVMRRKIVMGAKQHAIKFTTEDGIESMTPYFEGVQQFTLPDAGRILVVDHTDPKRTKSTWVRNIKPGVAEDIAEGKAKLIELFDPDSKPLKSLYPNSIDYVLTRSSEEKPLGFQHINREGAGHLIPRWDYYIKSADIDINKYADGEYRRYNGDNTLLNFKTRYEAEAAVPYLEKVRQAFVRASETPRRTISEELQRWENEGGRAVNVDEHESILNEAADWAKQIGIPYEKLYQWYFGDGRTPPKLNLHEPLYVVRSGERLIDMGGEVKRGLLARHGDNLVDATAHRSPLSKVMSEFIKGQDGEGLYTLKNTGTEQSPLFSYQPSELIDPITSINRSLSRIINSVYMYDMKQFSMEHWIKQAEDWLEGTKEDIYRNALSHFYNPEYVKNIPYLIKGQLESNRLQALDFIGTTSTFENSFREMAQNLADTIYGTKVGKWGVTKNYVLPFLYDLPRINDATAFLRGVGFYASQIGLKQFFTQASSLGQVVAVAGPAKAIPGTAAATLYAYWKMYSGGNRALLEGLDNKLVRYFGWKPGSFTNAVNLMENSGYGIVGAEHAFRSNATDLGLEAMKNITPFTIALQAAKQSGRNVLAFTTKPFEWGAAVTRRSAFFTSYLEHEERLPAQMLERQTQRSILQRASLLDSNMTSAMSSKAHTGLASIPMQFESYEMRMTEAMFGKQLTREQKMRLFAWNSAMYGIRGGYFAALGLPVGDYMYRKLQDNGYVPGSNGLIDIVANGFPSWAMAYLSGFTNENGEKTWIDFSKWGNRGIDAIDKVFSEDKSLIENVMGVTGNVFSNTLEGSWGLRRDIWDTMTGGDKFKINTQDVLQTFKALSAVNDINKTWLALQTGKWFTRNETYITDISAAQAVLSSLTGLEPLTGKNVWAKQESIKQNAANLKAAQREYEMEIQRAARDISNKDHSNYEFHMKQARGIMEVYIPQEYWKQTMDSALRAVGADLEQRANMQLFLKDMGNIDLYNKNQGNK